MNKVKLVDSTFSHNNTIGYAGENVGRHPDAFQWDTTPGDADVKVWTDIRLQEAASDPAERKIALLVEPYVVASESYRMLWNMKNEFDVILTHDQDILRKYDNAYFYPFGGSWIRDWGMFDKTGLVSLIVGNKHSTEGHKLRHEVATRFGGQIDLFGEPHTEYLSSKVPMLRPYRYSIVIENCRQDYFFSEKLIDCVSQGTVPIYWGCPSIGNFFDMDGIITFKGIDELGVVLDGLSPVDYNCRYGTMSRNMKEAKQYMCAEDWIWNYYPGLLEVR